MAVRMADVFGRAAESLRYEPTPKRLRASLFGALVVDTEHALLVWEPRRIVPAYAVPRTALSARLISTGVVCDGTSESVPASPRLLDPSVPFALHSCAGDEFDVVVNERVAAAAAFGPSDPDLGEHVILSFDAFAWREEDVAIMSHPRDPYKRIDALASGRQVRIEVDGRLLAESRSAVLLFETGMPVRYYLPAEDVAVALEKSETVSVCAYKGRASYFSVLTDLQDVAWVYEEPLLDATAVQDRICFFNERVDVIIDGTLQSRPFTSWSQSS